MGDTKVKQKVPGDGIWPTEMEGNGARYLDPKRAADLGFCGAEWAPFPWAIGESITPDECCAKCEVRTCLPLRFLALLLEFMTN